MSTGKNLSKHNKNADQNAECILLVLHPTYPESLHGSKRVKISRKKVNFATFHFKAKSDILKQMTSLLLIF